VEKVLILGATSAIASRVALCYARAGARLHLVARNGAALSELAEELRRNGATQVETAVMDALEWDRHDAVVAQAVERLNGLDVALLAHGTLPSQKACEASFDHARHELDINLLSHLSLLTILGNRFEQQGGGTIAVLSSVAGDRGRQSNYIYGAAKGAITLVLQGMRNRLHHSGVKVVTIKLGRVDTPMTASFEKGLTWARPESVAPSIYRAIERGRDVVYIPAYWRAIMLVLRSIPESVFKKLRL
jgi:short-subunit dehydrogenase